MLTRLHIENYALIRSLDISFGEGLSVLTGETGAGKSIILGALNLLMGARADARSISEGATKCIIEGEWDIQDCHLQSLFDEYEMEYDNTCIIRRELNSNGKSRSFVNDSPVTLSALRALSERLIDIHSQHENLLIQHSAFQREIVDQVAQNETILITYQQAYTTYRETEKALHELQDSAQQHAADLDYMLFQLQQLTEANLQSDEADQLETEYQQLTHAEDIQQAMQQVLLSLDNDQGGVLSTLRSSLSALRHVQEYIDPQLSERLDSSYIELKDLASEIEHAAEQTQSDPQRLLWVGQRLDMLNTLMRKHNVSSVDQLIAIRDDYAERIQHIQHFDEDLASLQEQLKKQLVTLQKAAEVLSLSRQKATPAICQRLREQLSLLGIQHANLQIAITEAEDYTPYGKDDICILFAANLNQTPRPVAQIASGGEIARLMLCIKALIADRTDLPTIIFDEIDTGVSGEIASQMGTIMRTMAQGRQVICITHLPQIAAKGHHQYLVYKQDTDQHTETHIRLLDHQQRVHQLARMLSGDAVTEAAITNAESLLG